MQEILLVAREEISYLRALLNLDTSFDEQDHNCAGAEQLHHQHNRRLGGKSR